MMISTNFWTVALGLVGALVLQAILLRALCLRSLTALRFKHQQEQSGLHGEIEQLTLHLLQLQRDQASAKSAAERFDASVRKSEGLAISARRALECELEADSDARFAPASDGFADTEILALESESSSLLLQ